MKKPWRKAAKEAMKEASLKQARLKKIPFNYRWEHVQAVVRTAVKLAKLTNADLEIVEAAAWLHDICKDAGEKHPQEGAKFARKFLAKTDFPNKKIEPVAEAIADHMGLWRNKPLKKLESQILWDADKLTKIGTLAIFHWTGNWLTKGKPITTKEILENGRSVNWIEKTVASMHTKPAQIAAKKRYKRFKKVWEQLEIEYNANDLL